MTNATVTKAYNTAGIQEINQKIDHAINQQQTQITILVSECEVPEGFVVNSDQYTQLRNSDLSELIDVIEGHAADQIGEVWSEYEPLTDEAKHFHGVDADYMVRIFWSE